VVSLLRAVADGSCKPLTRGQCKLSGTFTAAADCALGIPPATGSGGLREAEQWRVLRWRYVGQGDNWCGWDPSPGQRSGREPRNLGWLLKGARCVSKLG
jgi:hypothetical protein